ncbi:MAG: hypothetical protein QM765_30425 [Myxococcales bacterium]
MSYATDKAKLIAQQLERLATQNAYQLAGQLPNLEFWMQEAEQALAVVDGYGGRFRKLRDAQLAWVRAHGTVVDPYCPMCGGSCEFGPFPPEPPKRIPSEQMDDARGAVKRGAMRYLLRLHRGRFLGEPELKGYAERLALPLEPEDYARRDKEGEADEE